MDKYPYYLILLLLLVAPVHANMQIRGNLQTDGTVSAAGFTYLDGVPIGVGTDPLALAWLEANGPGSDVMDVYVFWGQSNMVGAPGVGSSSILGKWAQANESIRWVYDIAEANEFWRRTGVNESLRVTDAGHMYSWGPWIVAANMLAERSSNPVGVVVVAKGTTTMAVDWLPPSGGQYLRLIAALNAAIGAWGADYQIRWAGFYGLQGESDSGTETYAQNWGVNYQAMIDAVEVELGTTFPQTLAVISQSDHVGPYTPLIQAAQRGLLWRHFETTDLLRDSPDAGNIHFGPEALITIGKRFASAVHEVPPSWVQLTNQDVTEFRLPGRLRLLESHNHQITGKLGINTATPEHELDMPTGKAAIHFFTTRSNQDLELGSMRSVHIKLDNNNNDPSAAFRIYDGTDYKMAEIAEGTGVFRLYAEANQYSGLTIYRAGYIAWALGLISNDPDWSLRRYDAVGAFVDEPIKVDFNTGTVNLNATVVDGSVTADSFIGDGSGLTALPSDVANWWQYPALGTVDMQNNNIIIGDTQYGEDIRFGGELRFEPETRTLFGNWRTSADSPQVGTFTASSFIGEGSGLTHLMIRTSIENAHRTLTPVDCYNGVIYVTSTATLTLPAVASGMSVTVIVNGAAVVTVAPNAADLIWLDGTALDDGDTIDSRGTVGEIAVLTYYDSTGWFATTDGWADGGP